jgi:hypothetical protein
MASVSEALTSQAAGLRDPVMNVPPLGLLGKVPLVPVIVPVKN